MTRRSTWHSPITWTEWNIVDKSELFGAFFIWSAHTLTRHCWILWNKVSQVYPQSRFVIYFISHLHRYYKWRFFYAFIPHDFFKKYLFSVVLISFSSSGPPCLSPPNNTCQKMMNDCVIPGQGELTATFRAACHHKERAIPGLRSPCHCTSIWVKEGKERCRLLVLCCLTDWK